MILKKCHHFPLKKMVTFFQKLLIRIFRNARVNKTPDKLPRANNTC